MSTHNEDRCTVEAAHVRFLDRGANITVSPRVIRPVYFAPGEGLRLFAEHVRAGQTPWLSLTATLRCRPIGVWIHAMIARASKRRNDPELAAFEALGGNTDPRVQGFIEFLWHLRWHSGEPLSADHMCGDGYPLSDQAVSGHCRGLVDNTDHAQIVEAILGVSSVHRNQAYRRLLNKQAKSSVAGVPAGKVPETTPAKTLEASENTTERTRKKHRRPRTNAHTDAEFLDAYRNWSAQNDGATEVPSDLRVDGLGLGRWYSGLCRSTTDARVLTLRETIRSEFPRVAFASRSSTDAAAVADEIGRLRLDVAAGTSTTTKAFRARLRKSPVITVPLMAGEFAELAELGLTDTLAAVMTGREAAAA